MKRRYGAGFALIAVFVLPVGFAYAQSDGSVDGSADKSEMPTVVGVESLARPALVPEVSVPEVATSTPVVAPVQAIPSLPPAEPPPVVPTPPVVVPALPPAVIAENEPTPMPPPSSNNTLLITLAGIGTALLAALGVWKGTQGNKKKETREDPCKPLKHQLEQKKRELGVAFSGFSAQQIAVDFLKKKIEEKVEDKFMEVVGEDVRVAKKLYDDVQKKYEQAKTALEFLKTKKTALTEEINKLESAYALCKGGLATSALQSGLSVEFAGKNYEGTIIEESLEDTSVLKEVNIRSTKVELVTEQHQTPWVTKWTLHDVEVPAEKAKEVAEKISKALSREHPWYADFKTDTDHYIVYRDRIFHITDRKDKKQYKIATEYGIAIGIPVYQLDFDRQA